MWEEEFAKFLQRGDQETVETSSSFGSGDERERGLICADSDLILISTDSEGKKHETENLSNRSYIDSDSSSLPSLDIITDPINVCTMEKSNSDDDSVEKNPQPVINISSSTDLSNDSSDSLTIREKEDMEQFAKQLTVKEACKLILKGDKEDYVSSVPVDCIETSTFVIDTLALKDRDDLRIHMAGAMKNNRVQRDFVSVHISDGEISNISVLKKKPSVMRNSVYRLTRTYWMSKNTKGFKRRLYELHDSAGKPTKFAILQYVVEGDVPIFTNVHGNTKTGNTPYVRTSKRVLADIGEHLDAGKRAKETFDVIFEDAGGMKHVSSPLELPRNTKQIYNVKQTQKSAVAGKDRDSMFQLIKACKDQQSLADPYIRVVQCAPEFCCICSSDLQLMEMDMFLTNPSECTIMGIDPTFNLGEFVVTPIVYKNLKLIHRRTGECPTFLGPVLIHQTKTERAFDFFASSIVSLRNTLADTLFIGTDDECSIFNSFSRISCGFGFSHYTTNANESLNNRLKQKTDYQENEVTVFCTKMRELADEQKKDTEKAIIGMGPYQIRTEYIEHVQPSHAWFKLSESSRSKHITAFLKAPLKPSQFRSSIRISVGEQPGTSGTSLDPQPHHKSLSISLEDTHLDPTIHEPIWKKAESLVNSGLVNKAPGVQNGFMVASTSGKDPHFVRLLESGKGTCNCENFKLLSICSHVLAASECGRKLQKLIKYLRKTQSAPNLQELSKVNMPKHPQRKPNQKPRSNKRKPTRDFGSKHSTVKQASMEDDNDNDGYYLKYLIGTQIRSCYGCGQPIRLPPHVPPPPYDIVICQKEYRTFNMDGQLKLTLQPQNVHYHCRIQCILKTR
ncbi:unnamed protein product [Mytilus edulis]|uniref:SWIM-type domain-containing protein n=1 Tax=Mytilus edulis TaxID=6550 RepID=A0A8S3TAQ4_MYTED|nr:unnamed protein product [Mytilus edulis]